MAQAILTFYPENVWSKKLTRSQKRTLHWMLQVTGSMAAIIGMIIEYVGREQKGKSHFKSIHALFGLSAGILALISLMGGISTLWSIELKKYARPIYIKLTHILFGIVAFGLGKHLVFVFQNNSSNLDLLQTSFDYLSIQLFIFFDRDGVTLFGLR